MAAATPGQLRIAVIGAGTISQSVHLPSIRRAGLELVCVCDLSPTRAAEVAAAHGVRSSSDPAEVFAASDVDAVLIATPGSHARLALAAIRAGKHVLVEKPVALTVREIDELERAAAEHGTTVQVGYMKMYDPLTATAASEIAALNDTRLVRITVSHPADEPQVAHLRMTPPPRDADPAEIAAAEAYEADRAVEALGAEAGPELLRYYAGVLNGSVIHEFSLLRGLGLALPESWTATVFPRLDGPEPACLLAEAAVGDARYVLSWNWLPEYPEYEEELAVLASNGRIAFQLARPYLLEARSSLRVQSHTGSQRRDTLVSDTDETGFLRQLDAFRRSVQHGEPVLSTLAGAKEDVRQVQSLAAAIAASLGASLTVETAR